MPRALRCCAGVSPSPVAARQRWLRCTCSCELHVPQAAATSARPSFCPGHPRVWQRREELPGLSSQFWVHWVGRRRGSHRAPHHLEDDAVGPQPPCPSPGCPAVPWAIPGGLCRFASVGVPVGGARGARHGSPRLRALRRMWSESPWEQGVHVSVSLTLASVSLQGPHPDGPPPAMGSGTPAAPSPRRPPRRPPAPPPARRTQA